MDDNIQKSVEFQKCNQCGSILHFQIGTNETKCSSCGNTQLIEEKKEKIKKFNYDEFIKKINLKESVREVNSIECSNCGAVICFEDNLVGGDCTFCTTPLSIAQSKLTQQIHPESLLPFAIDQETANRKFKEWFASRWFAPNDLKRMSTNPDRLTGIYIPFWLFNADTTTDYTGTKIVKFDKSSKAYKKSGTVYYEFNNLDIVASTTLPKECVDELEPWDLENLLPFNEKYIFGFKTQGYQINLPNGFENGKEKMNKELSSIVKSDIGGDEQEIKTMETKYSNLSFQHVLLPIWMSSFKYKGKIQQFVINGRTGEVQGERPYSKWKLISFFLFGLAVLISIGYFWINAEFNYKFIALGIGIVILFIMGKILLKVLDLNTSEIRRKSM